MSKTIKSYNFIKHPKSGKLYKITGKTGIKLLNNYIQQSGGAAAAAVPERNPRRQPRWSGGASSSEIQIVPVQY